MTEMPVPERIGTLVGRPRKEIRVVDLSERRALDADGPLHKAMLATFKKSMSGVLTREEILDATRGHTPSDVERALRDLSMKGLVRVVWKTPFRFLAFLTEKAEAISRPVLVPAMVG